MCLSFEFFTGKYIVLYPRKKIIKFTAENNEIIEKHLLHLKFHPKNRMYYLIKKFDDEYLSLVNIYNSSDILLLQLKS
jgi:hypothetical protein